MYLKPSPNPPVAVEGGAVGVAALVRALDVPAHVHVRVVEDSDIRPPPSIAADRTSFVARPGASAASAQGTDCTKKAGS